jgi:hypothetical protein
MKQVSFFFTFLLFAGVGFSQQKKELFNQSFEAEKYLHLTTNSSYGNINVEASENEFRIKVEFIYSDEIAQKAANLFDQISVKPTLSDTSVVLTTQFDQSLFLKNNVLWDLKDEINIEYTIQVPPHVNVLINQKHGSVYTGKIANRISVQLDDAGLYSKFSEHLVVEGTDFRVDASAIRSLTIEGSHGHMVLAYISNARLDLQYCSVESFGFEQLDLKSDHSAMSIGKTGSCTATATNSTIEFTDIEDQGTFNLTDVKCVIQKLPEQFTYRALRGDSKFSLDYSRNIQANLIARDSESEFVLRGGTIRMIYDGKKTDIIFPQLGSVKKKSAEFIQSRSHGIALNAQLTRGQLVVNK